MKPQTRRQKVLDEYYRRLKDLQSKSVTNEEGLRLAFQGLLIMLGREQSWTLVPEVRLANGSKPDGTFADANTSDNSPGLEYGNLERSGCHAY